MAQDDLNVNSWGRRGLAGTQEGFGRRVWRLEVNDAEDKTEFAKGRYVPGDNG